jgi:hypothetical protein
MDASGIVGSADGGGDTSEPADEVVVVLTGSLTTAEETACGKLAGEDIEDQVIDVGDMANGSLEEAILGLFGDLVFVGLVEIAVKGNLFVVE